MSEQHHEEAHTGPIKKPKQLLLAVFFSFVVPIFVIIGLVKFVTSSDTTGAGTANAEMAKAMRLQKVGTVEIRDANRPLRGGAEVFKSQCAACHETGVAGAPKFQDAAAWGPRIKQGLETLVHSALAGKGAMAAQGGGEFNDTEIARGVVYMANAAGANFPEPQPAAGAAAGDAPAAAAAAPVAAAPAAAVAAAEAAPAAAAAASDVGKNIYNTTCMACHASGVAGAPKFGDKAAWAPFIAKGMDDMVQKATQGVGAMPPKGGSTASDADFKAAIQYMVDAAK
ncbi:MULTISPECIES: cytochrome c5 family protein [Comamonas]|uniref:c-type cytochrome n=1 Tax=Comamonas TaxID=283 RepID=UPI0015F904BE|nr:MULTISPECIES: c-type cytochrome [Comamonas]UUC94121.1 c-type cytochrome [Comamonas sp. C11]WEE78166.1 c-type cytochrome [Comamonas testosteroni]